MLLEDGRGAERRVIAALVGTDTRRAGEPLEMTGAGGRGRLTGRSTQERGAGPGRQYQHERKDGCSKHVMLFPTYGKNDASEPAPAGFKTPRISATLMPLPALRCGNCRPAAENPPARQA